MGCVCVVLQVEASVSENLTAFIVRVDPEVDVASSCDTLVSKLTMTPCMCHNAKDINLNYCNLLITAELMTSSA